MNIAELTKAIAAAAEAPPTDLKEEDRLALYAACGKLKTAVESPLETTTRTMLAPYEAVALRLAVDMKIPDIVQAEDKPVTVGELAERSSSDPLLVARIMRMLAGMDFFKETGADTYTAKPVVAGFVAASPLTEAVIHMASHLPTVSRLPEYFAEKAYQNPGDGFNGPWQYAENTSQHYFHWLSERPRLQHAFNVCMSLSRMARGSEWFEIYPVEQKLQGSSSDVILVDVAGGRGHDLVNFKKAFPNLPGRLVLEDLPSVVAVAEDLPDGIETVGHDFFKPQPPSVKGAKAYYLRTVLHDWPDAQAREILQQIRDVMSTDSVLLINENVLPASNVSLFHAQLDLAMMACFSALDRTEKQFEELLDSSGFKLVKIWKPEVMVPGSGTLFEAVLKQ